jgi:hypothetical protein
VKLLLALALAGSLLGGTASGTLVVNGHAVELKYSYAITDTDNGKPILRLIVTDAAMSEKDVRDKFGLFELKIAGKVNAVEVKIPDDDPSFNSYGIWSKLSEGSISGSGNVDVFKPATRTKDRIEGAMTVPASKAGDTTYEFRFTAACEILKRIVEAKPTDADAAEAATKEQTKVYLSYLRAIQSGNRTTLQKVLIPENAKRTDSPDFPKMIKVVQAMTPKQIKVWKLVESEGEATLTVSGLEDGKQVWGSVELVNIDGKWLISKERWGGSQQ